MISRYDDRGSRSRERRDYDRYDERRARRPRSRDEQGPPRRTEEESLARKEAAAAAETARLKRSVLFSGFPARMPPAIVDYVERKARVRVYDIDFVGGARGGKHKGMGSIELDRGFDPEAVLELNGTEWDGHVLHFTPAWSESIAAKRASRSTGWSSTPPAVPPPPRITSGRPGPYAQHQGFGPGQHGPPPPFHHPSRGPPHAMGGGGGGGGPPPMMMMMNGPPHMGMGGGMGGMGGGMGGGNKPPVPASVNSVKLYVGNLHPEMREGDLREMFSPFGALDFVDIVKEPNGNPKGFAFIQFQERDQGLAAMAALNGMDLDGRVMKVAPSHDRMNPFANLGAATSADIAAGVLPGATRFNSRGGGNPTGGPGGSGPASTRWSPAELASAAGKLMEERPSTRVVIRNLYDTAKVVAAKNTAGVAQYLGELAGDLGDAVKGLIGDSEEFSLSLDVSTVGGSAVLDLASEESAGKVKSALHGKVFFGRVLSGSFLPHPSSSSPPPPASADPHAAHAPSSSSGSPAVTAS